MTEVICVAMAFITASAAVFFAYRQGIKDGHKLAENKPIDPIISIPKRQPKISKEQSENLKALSTLVGNIDAYNGTAEGQKKVN